MIVQVFNHSKHFIVVGILALIIFLGGPYLLHHIPASKYNSVANGLLADVLITFPLAWYYFIIKPLKLKKRSILFVITLCCGAGYLIMPPQQQHYIIQLRKLSVLAELGIVVYALSKIKKIKHTYRVLQRNLPDTSYNLKQSILQVLGNTAAMRLLASELTILRFGLLCWYKVTPASQKAQKFTVYRESGYSSLFGIVLFVALIEVVAMHLLLVQYSVAAAAVVSLLSLYGMVFLIADISAVVKSPVLLMDDKLLLRAGMRWRLLTVCSNIKSITLVKSGYEPQGVCFNGAILKNEANMHILFKQPVKVDRIYRQPLMVDQLLVSIDAAATFSKALGEVCFS